MKCKVPYAFPGVGATRGDARTEFFRRDGHDKLDAAAEPNNAAGFRGVLLELLEAFGDGDVNVRFYIALQPEDYLNYIESLENTEAIFIDKDLKIHTTTGLDINNNEVTIK